jgi:hypothetical protein
VAADAMIINLVPEFLSVCASPNRLDAYHDYLQRHHAVLSAYWHNYVLDLDSPHTERIIRSALDADRRDLERLLGGVDLERLAAEALDRVAAILEPDTEVDLVLMVGVGAANAAELVVGGRGVAVLCVEHFTGQVNPDTFGLGLPATQLPLWVAHEVAHAVRYTSPASRSPLRALVAEAGGYDYWETGSRASLRELLVLRAVEGDLDRAGLGLRLRYLSGGMSPAARLVKGRVLPERSGYYIGARMTEALIGERGLAAAVRASPEEFRDAERRHAPEQAVSA